MFKKQSEKESTLVKEYIEAIKAGDNDKVEMLFNIEVEGSKKSMREWKKGFRNGWCAAITGGIIAAIVLDKINKSTKG
jgi:hypothetical protein